MEFDKDNYDGEWTNIFKEMKEFTSYQPKENDTIRYLITARDVINAYDDLVETAEKPKALVKMETIRHLLQNNPNYLEFHIEE